LHCLSVTPNKIGCNTLFAVHDNARAYKSIRIEVGEWLVATVYQEPLSPLRRRCGRPFRRVRSRAVYASLFLGAFLLTSPVERAWADAWHDPAKHNVQFVTVEDGVRLEVLDWGGSGKPVVLLAGLGFTAHVFDGFAEKLAESCHVYGITRRGYGASSRPATGYGEQRLAEDDLQVFEALKLVKPIVAGHSISGNEMSQLGIHHHERIGGLIYLDALNDLGDDWTDFDGLSSKLPDAIRRPPSPSPSDFKSFASYRDWRTRTQSVAIPEAEWRNDFAENPDGSVGPRITPGFVPKAILDGNVAHDYSRIRVPVLAFVGYPPLPEDQILANHITDPAERTIVYAVFGSNVGMIRKRIKRIEAAAGGARVVDLWGANHFVFLSNETDVLNEIRAVLVGLR
jgi:non-heme chloroperoxidase